MRENVLVVRGQQDPQRLQSWRERLDDAWSTDQGAVYRWLRGGDPPPPPPVV